MSGRDHHELIETPQSGFCIPCIHIRKSAYQKLLFPLYRLATIILWHLILRYRYVKIYLAPRAAPSPWRGVWQGSPDEYDKKFFWNEKGLL